jgi:hypothetical protein
MKGLSQDNANGALSRGGNELPMQQVDCCARCRRNDATRTPLELVEQFSRELPDPPVSSRGGHCGIGQHRSKLMKIPPSI